MSNTSQLGCFKILSESSVAAGIRRIEGTTGYGVLKLLDEKTETISKVAGTLKAVSYTHLPHGCAAEICKSGPEMTK